MIGCAWLYALIILFSSWLDSTNPLFSDAQGKWWYFLHEQFCTSLPLIACLSFIFFKELTMPQIKIRSICEILQKNEEEKIRSAAWKSSSFKIQADELKLSTSLAYRQCKRISLHKRMVEISNKLPDSILKAKWYK